MCVIKGLKINYFYDNYIIYIKWKRNVYFRENVQRVLYGNPKYLAKYFETRMFLQKWFSKWYIDSSWRYKTVLYIRKKVKSSIFIVYVIYRSVELPVKIESEATIATDASTWPSARRRRWILRDLRTLANVHICVYQR